MQWTSWINAFRLRTLPLALSCIGMGAFLAADAGAFRIDIFILCIITTIFLQILSNLANDYGDFIHGADHAGREGPHRTVQSGVISPSHMRMAVVVFVVLCLISGLSLIIVSLGFKVVALLFFVVLGVLSIAAAVTYTLGRKPYGYVGLGDLAVLIFFGFVGVCGSYYLFTREFDWAHILPSVSCGFFAMGVLNVNNMRDIESDRKAGKMSIPVRIGLSRAILYHWFLIAGGVAAALAYSLLRFQSQWQFLFLLSVPFFVRNAFAVGNVPSNQLDPWLRQLAFSTLLFVLLFGIGQVM